MDNTNRTIIIGIVIVVAIAIVVIAAFLVLRPPSQRTLTPSPSLSPANLFRPVNPFEGGTYQNPFATPEGEYQNPFKNVQ